MKPMVRFSIFLAFASAFAASAAIADDAKPIRHLVYNFTVTLTSDVAQQNYSGTSNASGGTNDRGQIVVDVVSVQPDTGLVVRVSENARGARSAEPAMCVTYGTGQLICDSSKKVNEEEYALLRLLGRNFINRAEIDANNHWHYGTDTSDGSESNDYTINGDRDGVLSVNFQRELKVRGPQGYTADTQGTLSYNEKMSLPVSESEETVTRAQTGESYNRLDQQISFSLVSDSMAPQAAAAH